MPRIRQKKIAVNLGANSEEFFRRICQLAAEYAGEKLPIEPLLDDITPRCNPACRYADPAGECTLAQTPEWQLSFEAAAHFPPPPGRKICVPANNTAAALLEVIQGGDE